MAYIIPEQYYFRLHHIRPRFKYDVERVLIFMASEISRIPEMEADDFVLRLNNAIMRFPGNATKSIKTINNWRTEISALFGFIQTGSNSNRIKPGLRAIELEKDQDLVKAFKKFLFFFQYPGGHLKPSEITKYIDAGIKFKPVVYILQLLEYAEQTENARIGISKAELTHCIFNDLRCTRDNENIPVTWERIKRHRENHMEYDTSGDVIRYAGDILDYMEIANLLVSYNSGLFYINRLENEAVQSFIHNQIWFDKYDDMILLGRSDSTTIVEIQPYWFDYVNSPLDDDAFKTDLIALSSEDPHTYTQEKENLKDLLSTYLEQEYVDNKLESKEIGDMGESLIYAHECEKLRVNGREDLIHLVKIIPTVQYLGYDVVSYDLHEKRKHIEVKATVSSKPMYATRIHLTTNEWRAASTYRDDYYIYRVSFAKDGNKLLVINDPVGLYKEDRIQMIPRDDGADLIINTSQEGEEEDLLYWNG